MQALRIIVSVLTVITVSLMLMFGFLDMNKKNAPTITCEIEDTIEVPTAASDKDLLKFVTAEDEEDGDLTDRVVVERQLYFLEKGLTTVVFSVCDSDNNTSKLERKIKFNDYHSPEIKMNNDLIIPLKGSIVFKNSVTLVDKYDGNISSHIKIISPNYNSLVAGEYDINFKATNSFGDICDVTVKAIVTEEDYSAASIRLSEYLIYASIGEKPDFEGYIKDIVSNNGQSYSKSQVVVDDSEYEPDKAGTYNIFFTVNSGNRVITKTRMVVVVKGEN